VPDHPPEDATVPRTSNHQSLTSPAPLPRRSPRLHQAQIALSTQTYTLEVFFAFDSHQANSAINVDTGQPAEYRELLRSSKGLIWDRSSAMEWDCLSDGCTTYSTTGTQAIKFIRFSDIPRDQLKDITYIKLVVADRPFKEETKRAQATVGGDQINYPNEVSSKTA